MSKPVKIKHCPLCGADYPAELADIAARCPNCQLRAQELLDERDRRAQARD